MSSIREPRELGSYRIEAKLGGGAFKTVYAAVNLAAATNGFPERVAVCIPREQDDEARQLLENELKIMRALRHPGIVEVYTIDEADGTFFAVVELVEGQTLQELLKQRGPLPLDEVLPLISQVGVALDFAHGALAIHRDIKPANLMVRPDGVVKVLDFGLARLMAHSMYRAATRAGTITFMAPEQFEGGTGLNTDLWALGLTCYQLLTNTLPFLANDEGALMKAILYDAPDLGPVEHGDFDPRLVGVFRKVLQKDPRKRYQHAAEFVADIEAVSRHASVVSQHEARLEALLRAHFPLVYLHTSEEERALESLRRIRQTMSTTRTVGLYVWSETRGLRDADGRPVGAGTTGDPVVALQYVAESDLEGIFVFLDLHRHFTPVTTRLIRDAVWAVKRQHKSLVVLSPVLSLPPELEAQASLFFYDSPDLDDMRALVNRSVVEVLGDQAPAVEGDWQENMAAAVLGLTRDEARRTVCRALLRAGGAVPACIEDVFQEKRQAVRKSGVLEYCAPGLRGDDVGGLGELKTWFARRRQAFTAHGDRFGLARAKGVVLAGVPGCGKSLSAKALAGEWNVPLLRLDMGRIYGSLLGQSEARLRQALHLATCVSPCVLWIDELEKAFAGLGRAQDGGATQRIFGSFLTWLSDNTAPVFVVATANDISKLPPEFTRAGRFDAVFFVDLPGAAERESIFAIHLTRRGRQPADYDLAALAAGTEGFSGAEIEESIVNALYQAFEDQQRPLTNDDLLAGCKEIIPLSRTRVNELVKMRAWARLNARPAAA
jgi:hypothetical protein